MRVQNAAELTTQSKAGAKTDSTRHPDRSGWVRCTPAVLQNLLVQNFPWKVKPDLFAPDKTILTFADSAGALRVYSFLWCYLCRVVRGNTSSYDPSSKSTVRSQALSQALERLSKQFNFKSSRARSVHSELAILGRFLNWADHPRHSSAYETVLSDPDVALQALKAHHSHLRERLQSHQITAFTAGQSDKSAIALLSEIHDRVFANDIEPLQTRHGQGTQAPQQAHVAQMGQMLQAVFDSAARLVLDPNSGAASIGAKPVRRLSVGDGDEDWVALDERYSSLRLAELACMAYAGLAFMDSGANLAVLQSYQEPEDLEDQLSDPDRINLTQKAIKFRARGKPVEVHLSAQTVTRIRTFMRLRQVLVDGVGQGERVGDIATLFVRGRFESTSRYADPAKVGPLESRFLWHLRSRFSTLGNKKRPIKLPRVTLRQLRAYKQQNLVRHYPVAVAAKIMGHSVKTAIEAYCKAEEATKHGEMTKYFNSLQETVLVASEQTPRAKAITLTPIPVGACADHGHPAVSMAASASSASSASPPVQPDCNKTQGCFFCDKYRLHADEADIRKLLSCRRVLGPIASLSHDSLVAHNVYQVVVDRVDSLLAELQRRAPQAYDAARVDVLERGYLTPYFVRKVGQLGLLQMLTPPSPPSPPLPPSPQRDNT